MPTNLPLEATQAWGRYLEANTTADKIARLEEYLAAIPKHKGVERLVRQTKIKLAKLREEQREEKTKHKGTGERWHVPKEGDAQIVIVGLPSSGKTSILNHLSGSDYEVADFAFTTIKPQVGSLRVHGAYLQLVELPAIVEGSSEGIANGPRVLAGIRTADLVIIALDISNDPVSQFKTLSSEMFNSNIRLNAKTPNVTVERVAKGGKQIFQGEYFVDGGTEGVFEFLDESKVANAIVKFTGPTTLDEISDVLNPSVVRLKSVILATKGDLSGSKKGLDCLQTYLQTNDLSFSIIPYSTEANINKEEAGEQIFAQLNMIRVYTRNEAGYVAEKPIVLPRGASIRDVASFVSRKMLENFRFARVWGTSIKFKGERVGLDHELQDMDQVQIYA